MLDLAAAVIGAQQRAAKAKVAVEALEPPMLHETIRDIFLCQGDFGWMWYVFLTGFCMANCRVILSSKPDITYTQGITLAVVTCYGGSTLAAILCGHPVVFLFNQALVPVACTVFSVMYMIPMPIIAVMNSGIGSILISTTYETMRCHVLMGSAAIAAKTLPAFISDTYPVPGVACLVCGILGGCGGAFLPFDKGVTPLDKGYNWRVASAVLCSAWMQFAMRDPNTSKYVLSVFPVFEDTRWVSFAAVAFCACVPLLQAALPWFRPLGDNPLMGAAKPAKPAAPESKKKD